MKLLKRWGFWCIVSSALFLSFLYCFTSLIAADSLGYGKTARGRAIMESWNTAAIVTFVLTLVAVGVMIWMWWVGRKTDAPLLTRRRVVGAMVAIGAVGVAAAVSLAGTTLTLDNRSGTAISNIVVDYGRGFVRRESIPDSTRLDLRLGKIGEGATFDVRWRDTLGREQRADFTVYLTNAFGYNNVQITFLPNGQVLLFDGTTQHPLSEATEP